MNSLHWEELGRLQRKVDKPTFHGSSNDTFGSYVRLKEPPEDHQESDRQPLQLDEEDPELARKRRELREIEEAIVRRKASIALKTVGLNTTDCDEQPAPCGTALRDRVTEILRRRQPSVTSLSNSANGSVNFSDPRRNPELEPHPLKLRVYSLMRQRRKDARELPSNSHVHSVFTPKVPDVPPPAPAPDGASPENNINRGFQRFLSILNKGVDLDLLSRIVSDDGDLQSPPAAQSGVSAVWPEDNGEMKKDLTAPEQRHHHQSGGSSSSSGYYRPQSPAAEEKKEVNHPKEDSKVDEQHEQLKSILSTLGLSLEVEEMTRLTDRTQERLYGKKNESRPTPEGRREGRARQRASDRHRSRSSSSSSSSSSSRSRSSRSSSARRSRRQHSHGRSSGDQRNRRKTAENRDSNPDDGEAARHVGDDGTDPQTYFYQPPYTHQPAYCSTFSHYNTPAYTAPAAYTSSVYSHDSGAHSYWTYPHSTDPYYPDTYPQDAYNNVPGPCDFAHTSTAPPFETGFLEDPYLCNSEGQTGSGCRPRCLQAVVTKEPVVSALKQLTKVKKKRGAPEKWLRKLRLWKEKKKMQKTQNVWLKNRQTFLTNQSQTPESKAEQSDEDQQEQQLNEEEIKANLRKKLEAFNQRAKNKAPNAPDPLCPHTQT